MMPQSGFSMGWMVKFVVVVVIIGAVVGLALARTDIANPFTSFAEARAKDQATAAQAQRDAIDAQARQQAADLQAAKYNIDQQSYAVQQMAGAMKQVADAKQYEAQQLAQAEADRQKQLAQVEVDRQQQLNQIEIQREQQLAQIRSTEQNQAQARSEQAARVEQELKTTALLSNAVALSIVTIAVALAIAVIFGAAILIWPRFQQARAESVAAKARAASQLGGTVSTAPAVQPQPVVVTAPKPVTVATAPVAKVNNESKDCTTRIAEARQREINERTATLATQAKQQPAIEYDPSAQVVGTRFSKTGKQPIVTSEPERTIEPNGQLS